MAQNQNPKPATYMQGHHESVLRSHSWRTAANSAGYLLPFLQPHMHILDIGCGPGTITADLASLVPQGHVIGVEPAAAADVLEKARTMAAERGVQNVEFKVGDVYALSDYADGTFDVVHAHQVLQHVGDPVRALREMKRVAKPGGGIVATRETDFSSMTWYPEIDVLQGWKELYMKVARSNGGEPNAGRRLHAWAREAGFAWSEISSSASTWCYSTPEERAWWSQLWADRTLKSGWRKSVVEGGFTTQEELERTAQAWLEWGSREDGWFVLLHGEVICRA